MANLFRRSKQSQNTTFSYSPLNWGEIRLLKLHQTDSNSAALSGSLITAKVDDTPPYEALSYVWGNESADCIIQLDNARFLIKPNLEDALKFLQKSKEKGQRLVWIDSICINQADISEKNLQVNLMKLIYQRAQRVVIWIGRLTPSYHLGAVADIIRQFAIFQRQGKGNQELAQYLDNPHNKKEIHQKEGFWRWTSYTEVRTIDVNGGHWPALVDFFDRAWWRRVWVRQELIVSRDSIVLFGQSSVPWADVAALCHWVKLWAPDLDGIIAKYRGRHRSGIYAGEDLEFFRQEFNNKGSLDFETMFLHARSCEATCAHDRVFAILGLTGEGGGEVELKYENSKSDVAKQAFKRLVSTSGRLDALMFSQNATRAHQIPSWAPNILAPFGAQPSRLMNHKSSSVYAAAGRSREEFNIHADGNTLSVKGVIFDVIDKASDVPRSTGRPSLNPVEATMPLWRSMLFSWLGSMDVDQKYERLMRAIIFDRDVHGRRIATREAGLSWATFFRFEHFDVKIRTEFEYLAAAVHGSRSEGAVVEQEEVVAWLRLCSEAVTNRRLAITSTGRICLVPAETQPCDVVCIIVER